MFIFFWPGVQVFCIGNRMLYFRLTLLKGVNYRLPEISISRKIWLKIWCILQSEQQMKLFCGKITGKTQTRTALQPIRIISHKIETNTLFLKQLIHPAILNASRLTDLNWIICSKRIRCFLRFFSFQPGDSNSSWIPKGPQLATYVGYSKVFQTSFTFHSSSILLIFLNLSSLFLIILL